MTNTLEHRMFYCTPMRRILTALIGGLFLAWAFIMVTRNPVEVLAVTVPKGTYSAGDYITVEYTVNRRESCPSDIVEFWVDHDGIARVRATIEGGYSPVGTTTVPVRLTIPVEMAGSETATYFGFIESYCHGGFGLRKSITTFPAFTIDLEP